MKHYELLCVLPGTLAQDDVPAVVKNIEEVISAQDGKNISITEGGKSRLAYPMKHIRYGYFYFITFEAEAKSIGDIQKKLGLISELLRAIIKNYDPKHHKEVVGEVSTVDEIVRGDNSRKRRDKKEDVKTTKKETKTEKVEEKVKEEPKKEKKTEKSSVSMEDIDKKLDEILESDMAKV